MEFKQGGKCSINNNDTYLPVVRYTQIYYSASPVLYGKVYCGTFYYYEPSSTTLLNLGKTLIASNKYDALIRLSEISPENNPVDIKDVITEGQNALALGSSVSNIESPFGPKSKHSSVKFHKMSDAEINRFNTFIRNVAENEDELLTYTYDFSHIPKNIRQYESISVNEMFIDDNGNYRALNLNLYAYFDNYDSYICDLAKKKGFDTIIFQKEPGKERVTTEVYDTRPREISYKNLCEFDSAPFEEIAINSLYPTVWFPSDGFINKDMIGKKIVSRIEKSPKKKIISKQKNSNKTELFEAVDNGNVDLVVILLDQGIDINVRGNKDETPLHHSVYNGDYEITKILLERGADPHIKDHNDIDSIELSLDQPDPDVENLVKKYIKK
jgi:hypothetical protein